MGPLSWFRSNRSPVATDEPALRLTGRLPESDLEHWLTDQLAGNPEMPRRQVQARLAEWWAEQENRSGSGALDLGILGGWIFRREAARALSSLEGDFLETNWTAAEQVAVVDPPGAVA